MRTLLETPRSIEFDFRKEVIRKLIHLASLSIPLGYWFFLSQSVVLTVLIILTVFSLFVDIGRLFSPPFSKFYNSLFQSILREHETTEKKKNLTGATYVLISAVICIALFPKIIAVTSFSILIISDTASALFGRKFGKHKFKKIAGGKKSWEGSIAFVLSAIIVILFTPKIEYTFGEYVLAIIASVGGAIAELLSFDIFDDNFAIPLATGALMWLFYIGFFPEINLHSI